MENIILPIPFITFEEISSIINVLYFHSSRFQIVGTPGPDPPHPWTWMLIRGWLCPQAGCLDSIEPEVWESRHVSSCQITALLSVFS